MKREKKRFIVLIIISIILFSVIIFLMQKNVSHKYSVELEGNLESTTEVTQIATKPIENANANFSSYTTIDSDSKKLLEKIADVIGSSDDAITYMRGIYYLKISPANFAVNQVSSIDFSGIDLSSMTRLPDFTVFPNLKRVTFNNCNIKNALVFYNNRKKLTKLTYIDLSYNKITNVNSYIVTDSRFNIQKQQISYDLGSVTRGATVTKTLPDYYTTSYGSYLAPSKFSKTNITKMNGGKVTLLTSSYTESNSVQASVIITDTNSKFQGSYVEYKYKIVEKSTNGNTDKNNNSNSNSNNNSNNGSDNIPITMTLNCNTYSPGGSASSKTISITLSGANVTLNRATIYVDGTKVANNNGKATYTATANGTYVVTVKYPGLDDIVVNHVVSGIYMELNANSNSPGGYAKSKNITIKLSGTNVKLGQATIYVNNNKVTNNNGTAIYTATKNGTYTIKVKYSGLNDIVFTHKVDGIDTTKPSYTLTAERVLRKNTINLTIVAKDNYAIKQVSVNGKNIYAYDNKTMYYQYVCKYTITTTGKYTIKVTDMAGNTYEKTEDINVDTTPPSMEKVLIEKPNHYTSDSTAYYSNYSNNENKCYVKKGNTIDISLTADEEIASFGEVRMNGTTVKYKNSIINGKSFGFEIDITDEFGQGNLYGDLTIEVLGVADKWGNSSIFTIKNQLYFDGNAPEIEKINLSGGTISKDKNVIEILENQSITIDVFTSEQLYSTIPIDIGGYTTKAKYKKDEDKYSATIDTNTLIEKLKENGTKNDYIPINISNYLDKAGNIGENITIDSQKKSSNNLCLVYGNINSGEIFLATTAEVGYPVIGDINKDGYITGYDYLLLTRYLTKLETLSEEQLKYADVNSDGKINTSDLTALNMLIDKTQNEVHKTVTLKAYDWGNTELSGEKLTFEIIEGNDFATITCNEDGTATLQTDTENLNSNVVVQATYAESNGYKVRTGKIKLTISELRVYTSAAGFEVVSENKTKREIMGDINSDGFVTVADSDIIQKALASLVTLSEEQEKLADINKDGNINIDDVTEIQKKNSYNYNGMKKGDSLTLKFNSLTNGHYVDFKDDNIADQIVWYTKEDTDMITINPNNEDGSANITINDNAVKGTKITVKCKARVESNVEEIAEFNIMIVDTPTISLNTNKINYDLSNLEENEVLTAITDLSNREFVWSSLDEKVAKVEVDCFGNAEIIPVEIGTTTISITVDGVSENCEVSIVESIREINIDKQDITLKETQTVEIEIHINPSTATEEPVIRSKDEKIASIYKNGNTDTYKIVGNAEGSTQIEVYSPSDSEIIQTIQVTVKKLVAPEITNIIISQDNNEEIYKEDEKINIKFVFSEKMKGEAPELNISFGNYSSIGTPEFKGFEDDDTAIVYEYSLQEGDNGILVIDSLVGGSLTDDASMINAILTIDSKYINHEEEQEQEEMPEESTAEEEINLQKDDIKYSVYKSNIKMFAAQESETVEEEQEETETEETEVISQGIDQPVEGVFADTESPTITIKTDIDKNSCWLTKGDIAQIKIETSEELDGKPVVKINGIEAQVEGEGTEYTASLEITDELEEGLLEITVENYKDLAGNVGETLIVKEDNIDEPIIVDNSDTMIDTIEVITEEDKEYKAGDTFKIKVSFADSTMDRIEYISAEEMPQIGIKFGGVEAQGKIECDYGLGEYVDSITYTYTIAEEDDGKIEITGLVGTIVDIAGNQTDLSTISEYTRISTIEISNSNNAQNNEENNSNSDNIQDNNDNGSNSDSNEDKTNNNTNSNEVSDNKKIGGILPYTGIGIFGTIVLLIGISTLISKIVYTITKRK